MRTPDGRPRVTVHNGRCHRYGTCQAEAPQVFWLDDDGRLRYRARPSADQLAAVRMAARCCPMQAIELVEPRAAAAQVVAPRAADPRPADAERAGAR